MAGRFQNPYPQFFDSTPSALSGCKLFFYAANSATKQNTYSDRALSSANTNPVVLNSAGRPAVQIWLQDLDYKVVLAPSTDTDPPTSPIWTSDYERARDSALIAKTVTGSGSPSGVVAGTAGSASILPDFYWDYTNAILYVCTTTGTTSTAVWTAVNASAATAVVPMPQGYLTLTSATPVLPNDVTAATSVYYAIDQGNLVPIYNGSSVIPTTFTELTLSLVSSHVASNIYDVFVFSNSGVLTLVTGPSWSAGTSGSITAGSCARGTGAGGTALARVGGIFTNAVQITGRNGSTTYTIGANLATYVGTIFMDASNGQITCHRTWGQARKWGVWNAYNRRNINLRVGDSTASWVYNTASIRSSNNAGTGNIITALSGLPEEQLTCTHIQRIQAADATSVTAANAFRGTGQIGIGVNTNVAITGTRGISDTGQGFNSTNATPAAGNSAVANAIVQPTIGITIIYACEISPSATLTNVTYFGTEASHLLQVIYRG